MVLNVLLFGRLADLAGRPAIEVSLEGDASVRSLLVRITELQPKLGPLEGQVAVALDGAYAALDAVVTDDHEVALIPPVSGG